MNKKYLEIQLVVKMQFIKAIVSMCTLYNLSENELNNGLLWPDTHDTHTDTRRTKRIHLLNINGEKIKGTKLDISNGGKHIEQVEVVFSVWVKKKIVYLIRSIIRKTDSCKEASFSKVGIFYPYWVRRVY